MKTFFLSLALITFASSANLSFKIGDESYRFNGSDKDIESFMNKIQEKQHKKLDSIFNDINKQRYGLTPTQITENSDPFVHFSSFVPTNKNNSDTNASTKTNLSTRSVDADDGILYLRGILNNRANINGKWYRVGEKVKNFTLTKIYKNSVDLNNSNNGLKLNIYKGNKNVIIKTK